MKPITKSVLAGVAGAGGAVAVDQYAVQSPPSQNVYYGTAIAALVGAVLMRKRPYAVGALSGIALGVAYRGYARSSEGGGSAPSAFMQNLFAEQAAIPRKVIGGVPLGRPSAGDKRVLSLKIAPYGAISFALAPNTVPNTSWLGNQDRGVPLQAPWPYGLDADRFAKPKPANAPSPSPMDVKQIQSAIESGSKTVTDIIDSFGGGGGGQQSVPYEAPAVSDADFYSY